jgi:intracellular septation protein
MSWIKRHFPFTPEQTLNIVSEIGPIFTMFVVNFAFGVAAGVWSLIITTVVALVASMIVLRRPPIMPFIAGAVTVTFGVLTLVTGDPAWVQIKVTVFNALVAVLLFLGLTQRKYFFEFVFGKTFLYSEKGWYELTRNVAMPSPTRPSDWDSRMRTSPARSRARSWCASRCWTGWTCG